MCLLISLFNLISKAFGNPTFKIVEHLAERSDGGDKGLKSEKFFASPVSTFDYTLACGGAIISETAVVTAAECAVDLDTKHDAVSVVLGPFKEESVKYVPAGRTSIDANFLENCDVENHFAVIHLETGKTIASTSQPIPICDENQFEDLKQSKMKIAKLHLDTSKRIQHLHEVEVKLEDSCPVGLLPAPYITPNSKAGGKPPQRTSYYFCVKSNEKESSEVKPTDQFTFGNPVFMTSSGKACLVGIELEYSDVEHVVLSLGHKENALWVNKEKDKTIS